MFVIQCLLVLLILLLCIKFYKSIFMPNGPNWLTATKDLLTMDFRAAMSKWTKDYGKLYYVRIGLRRCVVVSDVDILKDLLKTKLFAARPQHLKSLMTNLFKQHEDESSNGIVFHDGQEWTDNRKMSMSFLSSQAGEKRRVYMEEAGELVERFEESVPEGQLTYFGSQNLMDVVIISVTNCISRVLTGNVHSKVVIAKLTNHNEKFLRFNSIMGLITLSKVYRVLPGLKKYYDAIKEGPHNMRHFIAETAKISKSGSFVDYFTKKVGPGGNVRFERVMCDLFGGGSETTTTSIMFALLLLAKHPKVQEKLHKELVSTDLNEETFSSKSKSLVYTCAVIREVLRYVSVSYNSVYAATEDIQIGSFSVAKGTTLIADLWSVMHDKQFWGDPETFRPERFIENGELVHKKNYIPFVTGRRSCVGQITALTVLTIFIANIIKIFKIEAAQKCELSDEPIVGFLHRCPQFTCGLRRRATSDDKYEGGEDNN